VTKEADIDKALEELKGGVEVRRSRSTKFVGSVSVGGTYIQYLILIIF
tara:strand:+ start:924 stop:1067 length:144 start_codon:yes stop_codon:yes gene_type:complete